MRLQQPDEMYFSIAPRSALDDAVDEWLFAMASDCRPAVGALDDAMADTPPLSSN
jgi:hypothetical protein